VVGVTGASGALYAQRLVRLLLEGNRRVLLVLSGPARVVIREELDHPIDGDPWGDVGRDRLHLFGEKDFKAPFCSGTFRFHGMVIIPASMGTVASVAHGISANALHRGADVTLKEKRPLVVVPRECPLSVTHLENLLILARAGATIVPPSPGFYQRPRTIADTIDFVVSRVLDALGIENELFGRWGEMERDPT
jgi:4-hydroxy-3-polyprenylbenzoate decarboxylase